MSLGYVLRRTIPLPHIMLICSASVEDAFFKITAFCDVLRCLHSFREGFLKTNAVADDTGCLSAWIESVATRALTSLPEAYPEDCGALIKMAELYGSKKLEESSAPTQLSSLHIISY